jgi:hypothetical protein
MLVLLAVFNLITLVAVYAICFRTGITHRRFFAMDTQPWAFLYFASGSLMLIGSFLHIYLYSALNIRFAPGGADLVLWGLAIYSMFLRARCLNLVARK